VSIDLCGHGGSDHEFAHHYTLDKHASDVTAILDQLQSRKIILIGHSLGGKIATSVAPRLGSRIRAVVIVDSGPESDDEVASFLQRELRESYRMYNDIQEYTEWLKSRRHLAASAVLEHLAAASLARAEDGYLPRYDPAVLDLITSTTTESWWLGQLRDIRSPVLIVRGAFSACLSKRAAERMCAAAPKGELRTVPLAGHAVMTDNVQSFAQSVIPFIGRACSPIANGTE
jgi:pimeloyl-ACP methyl ester carboxylesterase